MFIKRIISTSLLTLILLMGAISISYAQDMTYKLYPTDNVYTVAGQVYSLGVHRQNIDTEKITEFANSFSLKKQLI